MKVFAVIKRYCTDEGNWDTVLQPLYWTKCDAEVELTRLELEQQERIEKDLQKTNGKLIGYEDLCTSYSVREYEVK